MLIGIPSEVKNHEYRVAITPAGVHELVRHGHDVVVEHGAGVGSSISDAEYKAAGARVLAAADDVWGEAELVLKVKEPVAEEYGRMRRGQVLFTYLHLAASRECTQALLDDATRSEDRHARKRAPARVAQGTRRHLRRADKRGESCGRTTAARPETPAAYPRTPS